jgi:hypothetical protein
MRDLTNPHTLFQRIWQPAPLILAVTITMAWIAIDLRVN